MSGGSPWWWPRMRDILAWLSTIIFGGSYIIPLLHPKIDQQILQSLNDYQGAIILQWGGMMGYYFGTSKSSATKDDTIATLSQNQPTPPPQPAPPLSPPKEGT